jgi:hypothetical protein
MGPNVYVTPEGAFTQLHQDGHGTVGKFSCIGWELLSLINTVGAHLSILLVPDSGHFCITGYNEVVMLRRLPERHKLHACQMAPGFEKYDPLYDTPHADSQVRNSTFDLFCVFAMYLIIIFFSWNRGAHQVGSTLTLSRSGGTWGKNQSFLDRNLLPLVSHSPSPSAFDAPIDIILPSLS